MSLTEIDVADIDERALPPEVDAWLERSRRRIDLYWDNFTKKPLPQYVECDFEHVARALAWCRDRNLADGRLFLEWGCGFAVVTGLAWLLGYEAVGIEAESFLCAEARQLLREGSIEADVWHGNFLPEGARRLVLDSDPVVSLSHELPPAYDEHGMGIDDFALIFAYPWPGEEHFLRSVFERYARRDAVLIMFRGPYQLEVFRRG